MPPNLALGIWFVLLLALLRFDRAGDRRATAALWIPVIWFSIIGSRLPAQWLSGSIGYTASGLSEGDSLDRSVYLTLIALSILVLTRRSFDWSRLFRANVWLSLLLAYSLASVLWSDYPFVAFKRWFRDLGIYFAILVILTSGDPLESIRWVLRRVFFLLIPLSVVFVKYFPHLSRSFDQWTGQGYFTGVATSKNMLGVLCMVSALYFLWDILVRWPQRSEPRQKAALLVNACLLGMTLWLLAIANSATSMLCLGLGVAIIAASAVGPLRRRPGFILLVVPVGIALYGFLEFVLGIDVVAVVSQMVGRRPDLTDRTEIWQVVLSAGANPWVGAGYESFWLGDRLAWVWSHTVNVNTAHNGYLETYVSLGAVGLVLLVGFLFSAYATLAKRFLSAPVPGAYGVAMWSVLLFYNITESAFRVNFLWIVFLTFAVTLADPQLVKVLAPRHRTMRRVIGPSGTAQRSHSSAVPKRHRTFMGRRPHVDR